MARARQPLRSGRDCKLSILTKHGKVLSAAPLGCGSEDEAVAAARARSIVGAMEGSDHFGSVRTTQPVSGGNGESPRAMYR